MVYLLAISGPTAAGKTYFTNRLIEAVEEAGFSTSRISTDEFYHDLSHLSMDERTKVNYDEPESIDQNAFRETLEKLTSNQPSDVPVYDFTTHTRTGKMRTVVPSDLIIVEGIFSLSFPLFNDLYNLTIFINLDQDLRLIRRLRRDMSERGRSLDSIVNQYLTQVRPSQRENVLEDREKADLILYGNKPHEKVIELIINSLWVRNYRTEM